MCNVWYNVVISSDGWCFRLYWIPKGSPNLFLRSWDRLRSAYQALFCGDFRCSLLSENSGIGPGRVNCSARRGFLLPQGQLSFKSFNLLLHRFERERAKKSNHPRSTHVVRAGLGSCLSSLITYRSGERHHQCTLLAPRTVKHRHNFLRTFLDTS